MTRHRELRLYPQAVEDFLLTYGSVRGRVIDKLRLLRSFPEIGRPMSGDYSGWRITPVEMFQIIYRVTPRAVEVLFTRHAKRQLPKPPR